MVGEEAWCLVPGRLSGCSFTSSNASTRICIALSPASSLLRARESSPEQIIGKYTAFLWKCHLKNQSLFVFPNWFACAQGLTASMLTMLFSVGGSRMCRMFAKVGAGAAMARVCEAAVARADYLGTVCAEPKS